MLKKRHKETTEKYIRQEIKKKVSHEIWPHRYSLNQEIKVQEGVTTMSMTTARITTAPGTGYTRITRKLREKHFPFTF